MERGKKNAQADGAAAVSGSTSFFSNGPPSSSSSPRNSSHQAGNGVRSNGQDGRRVADGGRGGGRGRGRGGRGQRRGRHSSANSKRPYQRRPPSIETADFRTNFHARLCRAARYKVHAPFCSCPKVVKLREANDACNNTTAAANPAKNNAYSSEAIQFDVDGNFSHQLSQLNLTSNEGELQNSSDHPYGNLMVVPDTKSTPAIYVCKGTDPQTFQMDGAACERKMAREIFGHDATTDTGKDGVNDILSQEKASPSNNGGDISPFKVNCAICLLATHQRNGFVAIVSRSLEEMMPTIRRARDAVSDKVQRSGKRGLHADHAHYVCALEVSSLQVLLSAGKTRTKDRKVTMEVLTQMKDGGVDLPPETVGDMESSVENESSSIRIKMGHHLTSLLWLLQGPSRPNRKNDDVVMNPHLRYMMVMGYVDGPRSFELDLPGGKRHLGESTLRGAVREVEEECSLIIDEGWFASRVSKDYGGVRAAGDNGTISVSGGDDDVSDDGESTVRVLEPRKIMGNESGDAFFVMTPPPAL